MRSNRTADALRPVDIDTRFNRHAEGSALISFGQTRVHCTASVEERVPPFLRNSGKGWVTAEYGMLPRSTHTRSDREAARGKQGGRTVEIQRLIGRSLRAVIDLEKLGERQIVLDCDVLQADGGTRTAAITGCWVALRIAVNKLLADGLLTEDPIIAQVAAVSCGFVDDEALLDLEYSEDSRARMDANFIMTPDGGIIEIQATAEDKPMHWNDVLKLKSLAEQGIGELAAMQLKAVASA
ncbi:MAG: ribonuclease PH [Zetaproteobacteria bacterium CG06_land_8_20_14_3_00_59_53]|nr:MAG: ribonuclease PH [Zetaproteobacteria bacterium CG2_30_59_37]PIO90743.1 MAG: ribonuclease PH [Zetaproteobacteria bacterium CG23_combo_of_CG06-09_8_20_14_all_59_86]PIQ65315.1 MAG: ribonuclease PH [Zetaproteobacteria bacterium CG11_big_fil_rev_8_21_14_0_20_59_439]PIU69857.1 MAG: ribonuclease PH [Zetaproteobacteria bacterium CG06_land_8_20_14_3_00_59_53]PIU97383.1 MAG: ribonuclease PH [Zetaproteobacteria bacterium CG03_land_8_20_14_0_80_59_51]PIY45683.1 MAG: ribonuclease PH [Zetaproteobacte